MYVVMSLYGIEFFPLPPQDHRILDFLGNLCVCGDRPIPSNQSEHKILHVPGYTCMRAHVLALLLLRLWAVTQGT